MPGPRIGRQYTEAEKRSLALMALQYGQRETSRRTGTAADTLARWQREYLASTSPNPESPDTSNPDSPSEQTQTPPTLMASDGLVLPEKAKLIELAQAGFMAYGLKSLDLADSTTSSESATKSAKTWFETLYTLIHGRSDRPTVIHQDNRTQIMGTDAARAAASSYQRRRRKRS